MENRKPASPLLVRFPPDLKEWLASYAEENSRTMTGQLIEMLKKERRQAEQSKAPQHA
jgi:hypothetical protein